MNLLTAITVLVLGTAQPVELNDANYIKVRDFLMPSTEEMAWRQIPWRPSLWQAVVDARRDDKPILLWAMNGHPLGCT